MAALVVYAATLTRGLGWDDSAELAAGVADLGVVHSTGYAPYVLLGHVFTAIEPFGADATRANLWSAVAGAAAVALVARYVLVAFGSRAGAVVAALLLAAGPMFWFQATVASVYPFLAFAVALLLNAADAWVRRPAPGRLALLSGSIGLVALAHAAGATFALGGVVLIVLQRHRGLRGRSDFLALAAVAIPLLAIVYIPLRSGFDGFPNRSGESVWGMVFGTSGTFSGETPFSASGAGFAAHVRSLAVLLLATLTPAALALVPAGFRMLVRERPYLLCCLAPAAIDSAVVVTMSGGYAYWHVPLLVAGAVACGAGVAPLWRAIQGTPYPRPLAAAVATALLVAPVCGALFLANSARGASDWSRATLASLPPGARLVAPWIAYAPLRAEQSVNGIRRDVSLELTPLGRPADVATVGGGYAVAVSGDPPTLPPGAERIGPVAGATFKGLNGLVAGPFRIGFDATRVRTYRLPG